MQHDHTPEEMHAAVREIVVERVPFNRWLGIEVEECDTEHAVFSYIPNTAEAAYVGLIEEIDHLSRTRNAERLWEKIQAGTIDRADFDTLTNGHVRAEKIAHKDQRMRTFITHDAARRDLVLLDKSGTGAP